MESEDGDGSASAGRADDDSKDQGGGGEGESTTNLSNGGITNDEKKPLPLALPLDSPSPTPTKGKGLKKWRRIQRKDNAKEAATTTPEDFNRHLKRDSSGGSAFAVVADSNNSEDPSSKSSTAASAPKFRHHHNQRNNTGNRSPTLPIRHNYNTSARYIQPGGRQNNKTETTKKPRGGGVKIDKDASYSSVESDWRSSNFFSTEISNGRHINFDVDDSSEAQASDQQSNEYFFKDNGEEEVSQDDDPTADASWEAKEEQSDNQPPSPDLLAESIVLLQNVHQALEKEIQKFGEIGKETECVEEREAEFAKIQGKVERLEKEVEEGRSMVEVKESRVVELEDMLLLLLNGREEGGEVEDVLKQRIEAEVECLMRRRRIGGGQKERKSENKILKHAFFSCLQFMLLILAFGMLLRRCRPASSGFVPT